MIAKVVIPPNRTKRSARSAILEAMLSIAEGQPPAPGAPHIYLYVLEERSWDDWKIVVTWLWPDDYRRVQRWLNKLGLLPEKNKRRREMIGRVIRFPYPLPENDRSEQEIVLETALDIFEGKIGDTAPPPPQIPVRILWRGYWGSWEVTLIRIYKADYLRVKRWMVRAGLLPRRKEAR